MDVDTHAHAPSTQRGTRRARRLQPRAGRRRAEQLAEAGHPSLGLDDREPARVLAACVRELPHETATQRPTSEHRVE